MEQRFPPPPYDSTDIFSIPFSLILLPQQLFFILSKSPRVRKYPKIAHFFHDLFEKLQILAPAIDELVGAEVFILSLFSSPSPIPFSFPPSGIPC